jgi:hypothetical protein
MADIPMGSTGTLTYPGSSVNTGNEASFPTSVVNVKTPNVGVADDGKQDKDKREIERLRSTSALYQKYAPLWNFFLAAYEGGRDFASASNIFRHPREHPDDFNERAKRLYYHNYCYPLVDFFTTFIFTETIQRDGESNRDWYDGFITDVNKKGEDITQFMMQVSDDMQIFGMSYILVDAPPAPPEGMTEAQQKEQGIRPYWVLVRPTEVLDWATDSFDQFTYLKRVEFQTRISGGFSKRNIERYSEWSQDEIRVSEVDITNPDEPVLLFTGQIIKNEMGKVPFNVARYKRSKTDKFMGISFLNDIAFISREVMNLTSLLQEFLYRQCFNILAMESDPNVPEIEQMQGEISTANMLKYAQGTKEPKYITPPVQPAKFLQDERSANVMSMYKIAAQDTINDLFNGQKSSGFSKSQSFQNTVPKIATRAETLQQCEMQLMKLTFEYMGKEWDGTIKYKDHYQITNLTDALSQLSTLFKDLQINSKTFAEMQMKRMIDEFDGRLTPDQRKKVYEEIEAIDWDEWFDVMKLAFLGRAALAPETALMMDEPDVKAAAAKAEGATPVKGKDTPTAASTPQRATSGSAEIAKEARSKK